MKDISKHIWRLYDLIEHKSAFLYRLVDLTGRSYPSLHKYFTNYRKTDKSIPLDQNIVSEELKKWIEGEIEAKQEKYQTIKNDKLEVV